MSEIYLHRIFDKYSEVCNIAAEDIYDSDTLELLDESISGISSEISKLSEKIKNFATVRIVDNITSRDAIQKVISGSMVWVEDASLDSTINSGSAAYVAINIDDKIEWVKIFEAGEIDWELTWRNIKNRPSASPEEIDITVLERHTHDNTYVLDKISENSFTHNLVFNNIENNNSTGIKFTDDSDYAGVLNDKLYVISEYIE